MNYSHTILAVTVGEPAIQGCETVAVIFALISGNQPYFVLLDPIEKELVF